MKKVSVQKPMCAKADVCKSRCVCVARFFCTKTKKNKKSYYLLLVYMYVYM